MLQHLKQQWSICKIFVKFYFPFYMFSCFYFSFRFFSLYMFISTPVSAIRFFSSVYKTILPFSDCEIWKICEKHTQPISVLVVFTIVRNSVVFIVCYKADPMLHIGSSVYVYIMINNFKFWIKIVNLFSEIENCRQFIMVL